MCLEITRAFNLSHILCPEKVLLFSVLCCYTSTKLPSGQLFLSRANLITSSCSILILSSTEAKLETISLSPLLEALLLCNVNQPIAKKPHALAKTHIYSPSADRKADLFLKLLWKQKRGKSLNFSTLFEEPRMSLPQKTRKYHRAPPNNWEKWT